MQSDNPKFKMTHVILRSGATKDPLEIMPNGILLPRQARDQNDIFNFKL